MPKHIALDRLLTSIEKLPSHRAIAVRVVIETNRETSSATSIGQLVEMDPALSALVLRLANSAAFGLRQQIASAQRAIAIVGLENVRSFAASRAIGAIGEHADELPAGMWQHALITACCTREVGPMVGVRREDAFSLGLLHDIGQMVLFRLYPDEYLHAISRAIARETTLMGAELAAFGHAHDDVSAAVLGQWGFPKPFTQALQAHHRKQPVTVTPMIKALAAGQDIALRVPNAPAEEILAPAPYETGLALAGIDEVFASEILDRALGAANDLQQLIEEPPG